MHLLKKSLLASICSRWPTWRCKWQSWLQFNQSFQISRCPSLEVNIWWITQVPKNHQFYRCKGSFWPCQGLCLLPIQLNTFSIRTQANPHIYLSVLDNEPLRRCTSTRWLLFCSSSVFSMCPLGVHCNKSHRPYFFSRDLEGSPLRIASCSLLTYMLGLRPRWRTHPVVAATLQLHQGPQSCLQPVRRSSSLVLISSWFYYWFNND